MVKQKRKIGAALGVVGVLCLSAPAIALAAGDGGLGNISGANSDLLNKLFNFDDAVSSFLTITMIGGLAMLILAIMALKKSAGQGSSRGPIIGIVAGAAVMAVSITPKLAIDFSKKATDTLLKSGSSSSQSAKRD